MNFKPSFNQRMSEAVQLHQKKQLTDAEKLYLAILSDNPNHPDVLNLLGTACAQQGKMEQAINYIKMAIIFNSNNPEYYCNLGEALSRVNNLTESAENFRKALNIVPNFAMVHFNLANVLKKMDDIQGSIFHYQEAIKYNPNNSEFYYNLGNTYRDAGKFRSSIEVYEQALKLNYNSANIHNNLAASLVEWDKTDEALHHYQEAIKLNPIFEDAYLNISGLYNKQGYTEMSINMLSKAQEINIHQGKNDKNDLYELTKNSIFPTIAKNNQEIDFFRERLSNIIENIDSKNLTYDELSKFECYPTSIMTYQGRNNKDIKEKYYELYKDKFQTYPKRPFNQVPHIGFVVTNGHEGVFLKCMSGIINNISKEKFKITIVCSQPNGQKILSNTIKSEQVNYLSIPADLNKAAQIVYDNKIDILHYWEIGTDSINYFLPYYNAANIQCTSWGWPDTSGIKNIDYYISCDAFETEQGNGHYTEKLVKFEHLPTYYYLPPIPEIIQTHEHFNLDKTANIYLCAQNLRKIHPDFDQIIFKILEKDSKANVLLIDDKQKNVSDTLKKRLLDQNPQYQSRIIFMPRMEAVEYLSLVKISDVILDTTYYTGGANTNYDAFACGTPVVTLPDNFHRGRYTTGTYHKLGILDCIATDIDSYVDIAFKIANDKLYREDLSKRILEKSKILFEDINAVIELENCFLSWVK